MTRGLLLSEPACIFGTLAATAAVKYAFYVYTRWSKLQRFERVGQVSALNIFPVKSCAGISVQNGRCTRLGLEVNGVTDRHWIVVRSNGDFLTQRQQPKMALIKVSVHGDQLLLEAPEKSTLKVPTHQGLIRALVKKCRVWDKYTEGQDCGEEAAIWLSEYLEEEGLRLLFSAPGLKKKEPHPGDQVAFSDKYAYLVLSEESLSSLNTRLASPASIITFRANIVVTVDNAFDEDTWQEIRIGQTAYFQMRDHCTRCPMTTVHPKTGEMSPDNEPLVTLKSFRCASYYSTIRPVFGVQATVNVESDIKVGDQVYAFQRPSVHLKEMLPKS